MPKSNRTSSSQLCERRAYEDDLNGPADIYVPTDGYQSLQLSGSCPSSLSHHNPRQPISGRHCPRSICTASSISQPASLPTLPTLHRIAGIITYSTTHLPTSNVLHLPLLLLYFTDILQREEAVEMPYKDDTPDSGFATNVARRGG